MDHYSSDIESPIQTPQKTKNQTSKETYGEDKMMDWRRKTSLTDISHSNSSTNISKVEKGSFTKPILTGDEDQLKKIAEGLIRSKTTIHRVTLRFSKSTLGGWSIGN
jgi:hypothetical protein